MLLLELAITFPDELSPNTDPGERRGVGAAKLCAPPAAYAENALVARAGVLWRDGERLRAKRLLDGGGDFGRFAALAKGEVEDAKASKPVRLWACGADEEDDSLAATAAANGEGEVLVDANGDVTLLPPMAFGLEIDPALAHEEVDGCLAPNMRGPCTEAKGELVDAYAANPPWVQYKARLANERWKTYANTHEFWGRNRGRGLDLLLCLFVLLGWRGGPFLLARIRVGLWVISRPFRRADDNSSILAGDVVSGNKALANSTVAEFAFETLLLV